MKTMNKRKIFPKQKIKIIIIHNKFIIPSHSSNNYNKREMKKKPKMNYSMDLRQTQNYNEIVKQSKYELRKKSIDSVLNKDIHY